MGRGTNVLLVAKVFGFAFCSIIIGGDVARGGTSNGSAESTNLNVRGARGTGGR